MKKLKMIAAVILTTVFLAVGQVTYASGTYTPTVTITKYLNNDGSGSQQHLIPALGVHFSIQKVIVTPTGSAEIDPQDPTTYSVSIDTDNPVLLTGTTDQNGKIVFQGANNLPKGNYELLEEGVSNPKGKVIFSLPYFDENGVLKDDVELFPKSEVNGGGEDNNGGGDNGGGDNNGNHGNGGDNNNGNNGNNGNNNGNNSNGNHGNNGNNNGNNNSQKPSDLNGNNQNAGKPGTLLQTSGELLAIPWMTMFAISFGLLFFAGGLFLLFKKEKKKKNNGTK